MSINFKQSTFGEIIESEREMVLKGADLYGDFFDNAFEFNNLLNNFVKSIDDVEKYIFIAFLSQVKKHHTLALLSAVRQHHIQTGMNLRQVLEAGSWAAYAMYNKKQEEFCEQDSKGVLQVQNKLMEKKNNWLNKNYKNGSDAIKSLKKLINRSTAHSNIVYTFQNFKPRPKENPGFDIPFFDYSDDFRIKKDLWFIGNIAHELLNLFYNVNKDYKVFQSIDDYLPRFKNLDAEHKALKTEMEKNERFQNVTKKE